MRFDSTSPSPHRATASIRGLGLAAAAPVDQGQTAEHAAGHCCTDQRQRKILKQIYRRTSINSRGTVLAEKSRSFFGRGVRVADSPLTGQRMQLYAQEVCPLAIQAADSALQDSMTMPSRISHIITVTCTGFFAPGFDMALIKELGLKPDIARLQVGFMGCHGALNALRAACAINASDPGSNILLCAAEICSLHFQYGWTPDTLLANSLFSDGAAAVVLAPAAMASSEWTLASSGSFIIPDSQEAMSWTIGSTGFTMTLSSSVPDLISLHLRQWMSSWLSSQGLLISDVPTWAIHPGGPRILDAVAESLQLSAAQMQPSREVLHRYGNMSSPTVFFIINELRLQKAPRPCVVLGFGPGLAIEAALFV